MSIARIDDIILGVSPAIVRLRELVAQYAACTLPVLIQGPTGSGKELVARALHAASGRRGAMVAFNVCAISDTMFEDALFGHVKGAFTGAHTDARGFLAEANGGTVFLDEVSGLAPSNQAKLLRAIETGQFRPVGGSVERVSDFRVVTATNEPLPHLVMGGRFRADLYYRLGGVVLEVPPLSARREDVAVLARYFMARGGGDADTWTAAALARLEAHPWPGNVRELRHVVDRLRVETAGRIIRDVDVLRALGCCEVVTSAIESRDDTERRALLDLLDEMEWDTAALASRLEVNRTTVYRRMQRLGIRPPRGREVAPLSAAAG